MVEEYKLIERVQNNNDEAFCELSEKYAPLIFSMVNKYSCDGMTHEDIEDLHQEAQMILFEAARTYNEKSNLTFGMYARICIRNGFISLLRKRSHALPSVDLSEELAIPDSTDYVEELESAQALMRKIRQLLSPKEFSIFRYLMLEYKHKQIAEELSVSTKSVENAVYRIKRKIGTLLF